MIPGKSYQAHPLNHTCELHQFIERELTASVST